ncbi:MAG: alpha/beta hydrolase family protein [Bryobacteraceae bacterium]
MKNRSILVAICLIAAMPAMSLFGGWLFQAAQPAPVGSRQPTPEQLAIQKASKEDRQQMMDQLHISSLRPPVDARKPGSANYDEAKANPYPDLPEVLVTKSGKKVTTANMWWTVRRPEIVEDFDREVYGRLPKSVPNVKWEVTNTASGSVGDVPVITKTLVGHVDNSSYPEISVDIRLSLTTPANAKGSVPVIMVFGRAGEGAPAATSPGQQGAEPGPSWQAQVLAKGWGAATLDPSSIQADNGAGLRKGIIGLVNKGQPRKPDDWGALRAWAWGADRAMDYFETDKSVDAKRVGVQGHSRYGKATIVTMAYDPRFAIAFVSSSGEGGAKLHRRNFGELVENVAAENEYHWMAGNFLKYAGPLKWTDLPVDSHELIALCAPRPVFIGAGNMVDPAINIQNSDAWTDARGMFMAEVAAGPVYRLLGKKGLGTTSYPAPETAIMSGDLAFRQHTAGHTPNPNWPAFLAFAEREFRATST